MYSLQAKKKTRQGGSWSDFTWTVKQILTNGAKIARGKQKKTIELVHNSAQYSTTYFTVQVKSLYG